MFLVVHLSFHYMTLCIWSYLLWNLVFFSLLMVQNEFYTGACILQYWNYGAALQPCKCPMCFRQITWLRPEASLYHLQEVEVTDVLKKVQKYNRLFVGGTYGLFLVGFTFPSICNYGLTFNSLHFVSIFFPIFRVIDYSILLSLSVDLKLILLKVLWEYSKYSKQLCFLLLSVIANFMIIEGTRL